MSKDLSAEIGFSFEAVLEAVQDSARGRWFLEELKKRSAMQDISKVSESITRIESRIDGMSGHFTAAEDLAKVRQAIATTRQDIQKLSPTGEGLSTEGRLFAHLADLARKSMQEPATQNSVSKALQLVDQLDQSLNNGSNVMAFPTSANTSSDKFFKQDAALFEQKPEASAPPKPAVEPVPTPAPAPKPVAAKPVVEAVPTGAKLTIKRVGQEAKPEAPAIAAPVVEPVPVETVSSEPVKTVEPPALQPVVEPVAKMEPAAPVEATEQAKPRIVIIRRKPEDAAALIAPAA